MCYEEFTDYSYGDIKNGHIMNTYSAESCHKLCQYTAECFCWTWAKPEHQTPNVCYLKNAAITKAHNRKTTSGPKICDGKLSAFSHIL